MKLRGGRESKMAVREPDCFRGTDGHAGGMRIPLLLIAALVLAPTAFSTEPSQTIPVWPDGVQGPVPDKAPERVLPAQPNAKQVVRLEGVTEASMLVFPAPKEKATGTAVIICPGGGFSKLALDLEGTEVVENFN